MNITRRILALLLCAVLLTVSASAAAAAETAESLQTLLGLSQRETLLDSDLVLAGESGSDWLALTYARTGRVDRYDIYLQNLKQYVTDRYAKKGGLDPFRATEWHRIGLTVLALGGNPRAFGTDAQGKPIDLLADGTYNYLNEDLGMQGVNAYAYALLFLDAQHSEIPADSRYTRESICAAIAEQQNPDGGFGLAGGASGIDLTAMVLQALAPYAQGEARETVQKALDFLRAHQLPDGSFGTEEESSCEASAQVILALTALGMDLETDFIQPEGNVKDGLLGFQNPDGSYNHLHTDEHPSVLATQQAALAWAAVERGGSIFDFTTATPPESGSMGVSPWISLSMVGAVLVIFGGVAVVHRRRRKQ